MFISFPPITEAQEAKVADDSAMAVRMTLDAISGSKSIVEIASPSSKDPSWVIDAQVEVDGTMREICIGSVDLGEVMSGAILWANGIKKC